MDQKEKQRLNDHKLKAWHTYFVPWRDKPVYCPYLKKDVVASQPGWRHICGMDKTRTPDDIHRRLDALKYAREIVENSGTCQFIRYQNDEMHYSFQAVVKFKNDTEKGSTLKEIKVIVKERKDGVAVFHSVM